MKHRKTLLKLFELSQQIIEFYPNIKTKNPYKGLADKASFSPLFQRERKEEIMRLYNLLVHAMTLLNHLYREKQQGYFISDREDNMIALQLLQREAFPASLMSVNLRNTYLQLMDCYGTDHAFTAKKAGFVIEVPSKTTFKRHLLELQMMGYCKRIGGNKRDGYEYILKELMEVKQSPRFITDYPEEYKTTDFGLSKNDMRIVREVREGY